MKAEWFNKSLLAIRMETDDLKYLEALPEGSHLGISLSVKAPGEEVATTEFKPLPDYPGSH